MSDERDDQPRTGMRGVFRRGDGTYYPEAAPGAGPEHHDDLRLTPEDVERKAHGDDPSAEVKLPEFENGPVRPPTPGENRIMDLGAMAARMDSKVLLVVGSRGGLQGTYLGADHARAHAHARALGGVVATLDVVGDYR